MPTFSFAYRFFHGWTWLFFFLFYSNSSVCAESADMFRPSNITIVNSEYSGPYAEIGIALFKTLEDWGMAPSVIDLSQPIPGSGLVIGIGIKAATAVAASAAPAALTVFIPKAEYIKLLRDFPNRVDGHNFSAIFMDQPSNRQAQLLAAIFPDKHNIGLLYSSPPDELANLRNALIKHGLKVKEQAVKPPLSLFEALQVVLRSSDVLLALPDAEVYNNSTIHNILVATYRSNVPLIGFSSGYVKVGALCAVVSSPAQIAAQAAALIRQFGKIHALPAAQYPQEFEVMINEQVVRSLGLQIKSGAELHGIMSDDEKNKP